MGTSVIGAAGVHSTAMGIGCSSSPSLASRRLWFEINHSWYGSNLGGVGATGNVCAAEHSVPIEENNLKLRMGSSCQTTDQRDS